MTLPRPEARGILRAVYGEVGGPAHPLIHLFKDGDGNLTALEIAALDRLLNERLEALSEG